MKDVYQEGERLQMRSPDGQAEVRDIEGGRRFVLRIQRPRVDSFDSKPAEVIKAQVAEQEEAGIGVLGHTANRFDYEKLMPVMGSPESVEMKPLPKPLEIGFMRHAKANGNVVSVENQEAIRSRVEALLEDLGVDKKTRVFVLSSTVGDYIGGKEGHEVERVSRTDSTAEVVMEELDKMGIGYRFNDIDNHDGELGTTTLQVRDRLREFGEDSEAYAEATRKFIDNIKAKRGGKEPVHDDEAYTRHPTAYASYAPDLKTLYEKAGIEELSSATVARGLNTFDALEDHFLHRDSEDGDFDKTVVILLGHGQFGTDISEGFQAVSSKEEFPVLLADNGGYWRMKVGKNTEGKVVEEYILDSGDRTGLKDVG